MHNFCKMALKQTSAAATPEWPGENQSHLSDQVKISHNCVTRWKSHLFHRVKINHTWVAQVKINHTCVTRWKSITRGSHRWKSITCGSHRWKSAAPQSPGENQSHLRDQVKINYSNHPAKAAADTQWNIAHKTKHSDKVNQLLNQTVQKWVIKWHRTTVIAIINGRWDLTLVPAVDNKYTITATMNGGMYVSK